MSLFPILSEVPYVTITQNIKQRVLKSNFDDLGKTQVKRKWLYPRRSVSLNYTNITNNDLRELEQFFLDRDGSYRSFTFIMPSTETGTYTSEYVGTGDGSNPLFNMPCNSTSRDVYIDGNLQTEAADSTGAGDYYVIEEGGQDGVDSCIFFSDPTAGQRITCDFEGLLAIRCRFKDTFEFQRIRHSTSYNNIGIEFEGLLIDE